MSTTNRNGRRDQGVAAAGEAHGRGAPAGLDAVRGRLGGHRRCSGAKSRLSPRTGSQYYGVLDDSAVPAVIAEGAYIANDSEGELLATPEFQQAYADAIYRALVRFLTTDDPGRGAQPRPRGLGRRGVLRRSPGRLPGARAALIGLVSHRPTRAAGAAEQTAVGPPPHVGPQPHGGRVVPRADLGGWCRRTDGGRPSSAGVARAPQRPWCTWADFGGWRLGELHAGVAGRPRRSRTRGRNG